MQLNIGSVAALLTALVCIADVGTSLSFKSGVVKTLRGGISLTSSRAFSSEAQQFETSSSSSSSSTSLSSGSTTPPNYLLPLQLRPEIAYFDAETGIVKYHDHPYERDIVVAWVDAANSPTGVLWLQGDCVLQHPGNGAPTSVHFDGISCYASQDLGLPSAWDDSPYSSFTLLWIGRPEEAGHSRTPFTFENSLFSDSAAANAAAIDTGSNIPPPPIDQWTMEVVTRSRLGNAVAPGGAGHLIASYYRYGGQSDELAAWRFPTVPSAVFYGKMVLGVDFEVQQDLFSGHLAVVLLYNRALQEAEVRKLAAIYSTRFGWRKPR